MRYARVFLSHASPDKPLVEAVADALARRGIIAWLDKHELYPGLDLTQALAQAIREHTLVAAFLSKDSLGSPWVDDELMVALAQEDRTRSSEQSSAVVPIFLGEAYDLVRDHPRLRSRWLHPDGNRVERLGIKDSGQDSNTARAKHIADGLASSLYQRMGTAAADDIALLLDQRGDGMRTGLPGWVPSNLERLDIPALVFRPDLASRTRDEVLGGQKWNGLADDLVQAISDALGPRRPTPRKIRILGGSQLALPFLLGQRLDRTFGAALYGYDRAGMPLEIDLATFDVPLAGGTHNCARMHDQLASLPQVTAGTRPASLVLLVLKDESSYLQVAGSYLQACGNPSPVAWIPHPPEIRSADQVVALARDIKAFTEHVGARSIEIITSLPFHVLPLLGALLSPHVFGRVTFLERDRKAADDRDGYVPLLLP